jgi:DNA-binding GntR family transcriptional regulator
VGRDRDPYERTLDTLRHRLRAGAFGHGQPLQILKLATDMAVSSTPIREALARLAGEGLIERGATGYRTPGHDATRLRELYQLDETYALAALASSRRPVIRRQSVQGQAEAIVASAGHVERTEALLARIAVADNRALAIARRNLWDRLAPYRRAEALVFDDLEAEIETLRALLASNDGPPSARVIRAYYRRRARSASQILRASQGEEYQIDIP